MFYSQRNEDYTHRCINQRDSVVILISLVVSVGREILLTNSLFLSLLDVICELFFKRFRYCGNRERVRLLVIQYRLLK